MITFHQSIRWRIQAWHGLILLVVLASFGTTTYWFVRENRIKQLDDELRRRAIALIPAMRVLSLPPGFDSGRRSWNRDRDSEQGPRTNLVQLHLTARQEALFDAGNTNGYYFVIWSSDGRLVHRSPDAPTDVPVPERAPEPNVPSGETNAVRFGMERRHFPDGSMFRFMGGPDQMVGSVRRRGNLRERALIDPFGARLVVGKELGQETAELHHLAWLFGAAGLSVLALGLLVGWLISGRSIKPIEEIGAAARKIAAGNLSERINVADAASELSELAQVLNETFERLRDSFARQAQFTADASHELRTTAFIILSQTQSALKRERSQAEYREGFEACLRAAQQMRKLIESLLILARHDVGENLLCPEPCKLDQIAAEVVTMLRPLATERNVSLHTDLKPIAVSGNRQQLNQVLINLISNAIEYNRPGCKVEIKLERENDRSIMTVSDNGHGISAEDLPRIFDRFFRADKSRSSNRHTGLGLAICKSIIETHKGSIEATSRVGVGTTIVVRIPIPTAADHGIPTFAS